MFVFVPGYVWKTALKLRTDGPEGAAWRAPGWNEYAAAPLVETPRT